MSGPKTQCCVISDRSFTVTLVSNLAARCSVVFVEQLVGSQLPWHGCLCGQLELLTEQSCVLTAVEMDIRLRTALYS